MEELKKLEEVHEPDSRQRLFVGFGDGGKLVSLSLSNIYQSVEALALSESVPEHIRGSYNTARNLYLYSWFVYGFIPVATFHAYSTVEYALRWKFGDAAEGKSFRWCMEQAVSRGWIKDEGFRTHRERETQRRENLEDLGRQEESPADPQRYCRIIADTMPSLRNSHAHGHSMVYPWGMTEMENCADLINQLFVGHGEEQP